MRHADVMTFRGALRVLGHHNRPIVDRLDTLLGGVIMASGVVTALAPLWGWVDQKNEATGLLRKLLNGVSARRTGTAGYDRTQLIAAAHTILVTSSFMETFRAEIGRGAFKRLALTTKEQQYLLTGRHGQNLFDAMYQATAPIPTPSGGFHENLAAVERFHLTLANRAINFLSGLEEGKGLPVAQDLVVTSVARYSSRYRELAAQVPEFMVWALLGEHRATRVGNQVVLDVLAEQSIAFSRLESLLTALSGPAPARDLVAIVRRSAVAELDEPIVPRGAEVPDIRFPSIRDSYVEPHYQVTAHGPDTRISDEHWWDTLPVQSDLDLRLATYLSTPDAARQPLLLLGHPGAGKSLLTKILAARLPDSGYTAVHVPLRHVTADAPIYRQVQEALDRTTHGRVDWYSLTDQSEGTLRVVLLDGLDELLQASEHSRSGFLHEVIDFQRREAEQLRPVAVVVTSRSVVADRVDVVPGTTVVKLADFTEDQVERWRETWNRTNAAGIAGGLVRSLTADAVAGCGDLAAQPLLLLMVAMYSADPAALPIEAGLSQTALYERMLENFARREATKTTQGEVDELVRDHLRQLSVAALGMFNRGRQHITDAELAEDLAALGMRTGGDLFGRFFFVHIAQMSSGVDGRQRSYEFLHATFGEYLVAREIVDVLLDVVDRSTSRRGNSVPDDSLLHTLMSHECLAVRRSIVDFLGQLVRDLPAADLDAVLRLAKTLFASSHHRRGTDRYPGYKPSDVDVVRAVAVYSANLVLVRLAPGQVITVPDRWVAAVTVWRAGLDPGGWQALLSMLDRRGERIVLTESNFGDEDSRYAVLIGNEDLFRSLRMGEAIRYSFGFRQDIDVALEVEDLALWLVRAIVTAPEPYHFGAKRWPAQMIEERPFLRDMLMTALVRRSDVLPYTVVRSLVERIFDRVPPWPEGVVVAVFNHPKLLVDLPELRDPAGYTDRDAAWLVLENRFGEGDVAPGKELLDELLVALKARFESWPW
jgi:hypothetical protein